MSDDIVNRLRARHADCLCSLIPIERCAQCDIDIAAAEKIEMLRGQRDRLLRQLTEPTRW